MSAARAAPINEFVIALLLCALTASPAAEPLRLAEVLARVEERGPEQRAINAQLPVARAEVRGARMWPNPGLVIGAGRSEPVFNAAVQLPLPIFGQREARVRATEKAVQQADGEAAAARWRLRHDARLAYWTVARADEQVTIAVEVEGLTRRIAEMAREKYEVGSGTRLDQRQAELLHVRALQDVSDRQAAARVARLELARQLGDPSGELGPLADPLAQAGATPSLDELLAAARDRHPELRALRSEREAALSRATAARADRRPLPTLELGVELLDASTCGGSNRCVGPRAALGFDLPVFNLNGGPIERAQAEARLAELRAVAVDLRG